MTVLYGSFINEAREKSTGKIHIFSQHARPAYEGAEIVTREVFSTELVDGSFETPDLDPGTIVVQLEVEGSFEDWPPVDLPTSGRVNFKDLLGKKVDYSPDVVNRVDAALSQIAAAEKRITSTVDDATKAVETRLSQTFAAQVQAAKQAAERAEAAAQNTVVGAPDSGWARNQLASDVQASLAKADKSVSADDVDSRVKSAVEPLAQTTVVDALSRRVSALEGVDTPDFTGYATKDWVTGQLKAKAEASAVTSLQQLVENQRQQIQSLQDQISKLVASNSVRHIELGTGSDATTLYVEGA